jgi:DNA 3'-phosphatase
MFDLDGTLINTKSGNKFPKTSKDWQWLPGVMDRLRELVRTDANALIVIVSNQKVSSTNEEKKKLVQNKIKDVFKTLVAELHDDARVCVYASTDADKYRKPSTGIFEGTFEPPAGPVFTVTLDVRIGPSVQWGRTGHTVVEAEGRRIELTHHSWVMP